MEKYEVTLPGRGTFNIESPTKLNDAEVYQMAMLHSKEKMKQEVEGVSGGITRGWRDPIDAMAQMLPRILSTATSLGGTVPNEVSKFLDEEAARVDALNLAVEQKYQEQKQAEGREGVDVKRIVGNIVNPVNIAVAARAPAAVAQTANIASKLPMMANVGQKVAQLAMTPTGQTVIGGAAANILEPIFDTEGKDFAEEKAKQAGIGATVGYGGQKLIGGVGKVLAPTVSSQVRALADMGVELTPGQIFGGAVKKLEEGLKSIPIAGDIVSNAEMRAIESFNRAAINKTLAPLGKEVPKNLVGREALNYADDIISKAYDKVLTKVNLTADNDLLTDLANITGKALQELPADRASQLDSIITRNVLDKMQGTVKGTVWKSIDSELGRLAKTYMNSAVGDERLLGNAIKEAQLSVRSLLERANPRYAQQIGNANKAFANYLRVERATGAVGAPEGVFTPAQLLSASKAMDESLRKGRFSKGGALMQDLAEQGKSVIGSKLPDSGTAYRGLTSAGILGGALLEPTTLFAPLAVSALYSKPGQDLARLLVLQRPEALRQAGSAITRTSPLVSNILAPGLLGEK